MSSTAELFAEALDTATVLLRAGATWLVLCAGACGLAVYAVVVVAWAVCRWAWKTARRALGGRRSAAEAFEAEPEPETAPRAPQRRPRPSWAHEPTDDYDIEIEEAA